jgi:hypothetical protein
MFAIRVTRRFSVLATFLFVVLISSAHAELQLTVTGDSLWVGAGADRTGFPVSMLTGNDTLRLESVTSIWLWSETDSVLVTKTSRFVPVKVSLKDRVVTATFFFDSFLDQLQDRLEVLHKYPSFGNTPPPRGWTFSYQPPTDSGLTALRRKFDLDRVAGTGSDFSRALNLLRWAHRIVRHDGASFNPQPANALNLIQVCADSGRGVNCRMMATILNEACLAEGLRSKHLTCLPADKSDTECHVVDAVWSDSLNKWVFLDPTFLGYFTDARGVLQSPEEIRAAYITGDSLVVSPELDYNGVPHNPEEYRAYLAKNIFRFVAPIESAFNYESRPADVVWIYLNPLGYDQEKTAHADTSGTGEHKMISICTDNAAWFWGR